MIRLFDRDCESVCRLLLVLALVANIVFVPIVRMVGYIMYPFFAAYYVWTAAYVALLTLLLWWDRITQRPLLHDHRSLGLVLVLLVAVRLVFLGQTNMISNDAKWYLDYGVFMSRGLTPYSGFYFPYPPLFAYVIFAIYGVAPAVDSLRLLAIACDAGVAVLLWAIASQRFDRRWASIAVVAYALLPISIIESGWSGHFEPLVNLLMLLAVWYLLKQRPVRAGLLIGLGAATKVYPALIAPMMLFYLAENRARLKFAATALAAAVAAYLPLMLLPSTDTGSAATGAASSMAQPSLLSRLLSDLLAHITPVTLLIALGWVFGIIVVADSLLRPSGRLHGSRFDWTTLFLGGVLVTMGLISSIHPLTSVAATVWWRHPADVGLVRGVVTVIVASLMMRSSLRRIIHREHVRVDQVTLLLMMSATVLLLFSMSRDVFLGWYLMWSLPLFLLVRKRTLGLTVVICLLMLYPAYTHTDFGALGYQEQRTWGDDLDSIDEWSVMVNASSLPPSTVDASISSTDGIAHLEFDTSRVTDPSLLANVSIIYSRPVEIEIDSTTEFVARIGAAWDPTFGALAHIILRYSGTSDDGSPIGGDIISRSAMFTNLSYVVWRYAFVSNSSAPSHGVIHRLEIIVYPQRCVRSEYLVDYLYTTYVGPLYPVSAVTVPALLGLSIIAYAGLRREQEMRAGSGREDES